MQAAQPCRRSRCSLIERLSPQRCGRLGPAHIGGKDSAAAQFLHDDVNRVPSMRSQQAAELGPYRLAADADLRVRAAAASNPNCPMTSLGRLHRDPSRTPRPAAAFSPPPWSNLATHPRLLISDAFDANPGCPPRLIQCEAALAGLGA